MKLYSNDRQAVPICLPKNVFNIMRITVVLCLLTTFCTFASVSYSQNAEISLNLKGVTLQEAIDAVKEQSDFSFWYRNEEVDLSKLVSIKVERQNIDKIMSQLLSGQDLAYSINDKHIIIYKKEAITVTSQQNKKQISGTITDQNGEPLIGVSIVEKGTSNGTVTNIDGKYSLTVSINAILSVSYIGYLSQDTEVKDKTIFNLSLTENSKQLDEVVVIGYGTVRKSDLTGSVTSLKSDALRDLPSNNVSQALQGRVPGVQIQQNSGAPGASMQIRVRGSNSITGNNEPLWIINGFPGDQNMINSSDIESVEVLKDASATAIYGSRGANGVIIVTTKQAKEGRVSVDYEGSYSIQTVRSKLDLMDAGEYAQYYNTYWEKIKGQKYFSQEDIAGFDKGTDWQNLIFRSAPVQDHSLTVNGGNDKTQFAIGASYYNQEGIIKNNNYQRIVVRANINHEINKKFSISYNSILSRTNENPTDDMNVLLSALSASPTVGPFHDNGKYRLLNGVYPFSPDNLINPIAYFNEVSNKQTANKVMANLAVTYKPIDGLSIKISGNVTNSDNRSDNYTGVEYPNSSGNANIGTSNSFNLNSDNIITYNKTFNKEHTIIATGAFTYENYTYKSLNASGSGFLSDATESFDIGSATTVGIPSSSYSDWKMLSYLGRFNYSYKSKYLATISFRADGSSRYSEGHKWGYFPSGALAWRISEEKFMKNLTFISDAKLRLGYGQTGSTAIDPYFTLNMLTSGKEPFDNALYTYYAPGTRLPSDLKWETTSQTDIGLDLSLFNNRLRLTADYYIKNTRDLLNTVQLPASLGYTTTVKNIGKVKNQGFEFQVDANILDGDFKWDVSANISLNRNKVIKLYNGQDIQGSTYNLTVANDYVNILREGMPMSTFYGYQTNGFDENGHFTYKDNNHDGKISEEDKAVIGNPNPDFIYGLTTNLSWKNFDLSLFFQGSQGNDIFSFSMITQNYKTYIGYNMLKEVFYNHWTPENKDAKYPAIDNVISTKMADCFVYNGSYLRLKNIKLAYNIPVKKLGINWLKRGQIYISGQNLLTFTSYPWWDPEVNSKGGGTSVNQGIDYYSYPTNKGFTVGAKLSF